MGRKTRLQWALALLTIVSSSQAVADEMPVPANLQGAIIRKVFDYVKTLEQNELKLLVIYKGERSPLLVEMTAAFQEAGLSPTVVEVGQLPAAISSAKALYTLPGVDPSTIKSLCGKYRVLSLSGVPKLAERGDVSISLGNKDGRPQILVNITRIQAEGHELSSELLRLATVIQ